MKHLSLDEIGDLDSVAGHPHLAECERCRRAVQEQSEVRDLLTSLPDPGRMPVDVMARVDRALVRARSQEPVPAGTDETPDRPAVADPEPTREHVGDRGDAAAAAHGLTITPDRERVVPLEPRRRGTRRVNPWFAAAAALVVLGGAGAAVQGLGVRPGGTESAGSSAEDGATRVLGEPLSPALIHQTGTDYTKARLASQLAPLLTGSSPAYQGGKPSTGSSGTTGGQSPARPSDAPTLSSVDDDLLATPAGVTGCLDALGMSGATVLAVDLARFQGEPAAILALHPADSGADVTEVWVVDPGCRPGSDGTRFFTRLP